VLELPAPVCVSSGPWSIPDGVDRSCIGSYTTKSVTPKPREGNSGTTFVNVDGGYINNMGLPSPGIESWAESYEPIGVPTFVSLALFDQFNVGRACRLVKDLPDVIGVELNISCPNVAYETTELCNMLKFIKNFDLLTSVKISAEEAAIRKALSRSHRGIDALVVSNAHVGAAVVNGGVIRGGLSGPAIRHRTLSLVKYAADLAPENVTIVACGGVTKGQDVKDYMDAGATYVQVGSAHISEPDCTTRITSEYLEII
jgi:dihydroorotate dehydrogenase (NAD+) catalytic subunit